MVLGRALLQRYVSLAAIFLLGALFFLVHSETFSASTICLLNLESARIYVVLLHEIEKSRLSEENLLLFLAN